MNGNILAVANEISGMSLIDIRMNKTLLRYNSHFDSTNTNQNVMSVGFNRFGTHLAALRHSNRPVIYETNNASPAYIFDSEGLANSCTLKSCCFAGNSDQYLVTGSDDFSVNCWKIPDNKYNGHNIDGSAKLNRHTHLKLYGHRSIVNQCRYNQRFHLLASSGVEKIIKIWSPYELPGCSNYGGLSGKEEEYPSKREASSLINEVITNDAQASIYTPATGVRTESIIEESLEEDQEIISYFDAQLRRNSESKKSPRIQ